MAASFFRHFLFRNRPPNLPQNEYKMIILNGQLSILCGGIGVFYIVFDMITQAFGSLLVYALLGGGSLLVVALIRLGRYELAKVVSLLNINAVVYLFVTRQGTHLYGLMYFIPICMASFAMFGHKGRYKALLMTLMSLGLAALALLSDYSILEKVTFSPELDRINQVINTMIAMISATVIIQFLIRLNHNSEKELSENGEYLKELAQQLESSQRQYALALRGINSGLWDWDITNNVMKLSVKWKRMLGYAEEELVDIPGQTVLDMVHPDHLDRVSDLVNRHLLKQEPYNMECKLRMKSGEYRWFSDSAQAEWNSEGRAVRMVGSMVDITDRKLAEEQITRQNAVLEKTNQELDKFVYSTSHDLRAPLRSMMGLVNIARQSNSIEEISACIDMMDERVKTLDDFVQEIIDYSRNSRVELKPERIELNELVKQVIDNLRFIENISAIDFRISIDPQLQLEVDKSRLRTILNNLIYNAVKYHNYQQQKPYVLVSAEKGNPSVVLKVEDNGIGIEPDFQKKVFDMFYRASEISKGSGLGLYIANEAAVQLGGMINLQSEPGVGSEFRVTLPNR